MHELHRVFYDRLVFDEDRLWLFGNVKETANDVLGMEFNTIFSSLNLDSSPHVEDHHLRSLVFCDFEDPKAPLIAGTTQRAYMQVEDPTLELLRGVVESKLDAPALFSIDYSSTSHTIISAQDPNIHTHTCFPSVFLLRSYINLFRKILL